MVDRPGNAPGSTVCKTVVLPFITNNPKKCGDHPIAVPDPELFTGSHALNRMLSSIATPVLLVTAPRYLDQTGA